MLSFDVLLHDTLLDYYMVRKELLRALEVENRLVPCPHCLGTGEIRRGKIQ